MVAYNPNTREAEAEDGQSENITGYITQLVSVRVSYCCEETP